MIVRRQPYLARIFAGTTSSFALGATVRANTRLTVKDLTVYGACKVFNPTTGECDNFRLPLSGNVILWYYKCEHYKVPYTIHVNACTHKIPSVYIYIAKIVKEKEITILFVPCKFY